MAFVLPGDYPDDDLTAFQRAWQGYNTYIQDHAGSFPASAFALATAPWYYDPADPRCPHDAWVESLTISEPAQDEHRDQRTLAITIRMLGAYHDGIIQLSYARVFSYALQKPALPTEYLNQDGHSDWLVDELRLNDQGHLIHEIVFASQAHWVIECEDVDYRWMPFDTL